MLLETLGSDTPVASWLESFLSLVFWLTLLWSGFLTFIMERLLILTMGSIQLIWAWRLQGFSEAGGLPSPWGHLAPLSTWLSCFLCHLQRQILEVASLWCGALQAFPVWWGQIVELGDAQDIIRLLCSITGPRFTLVLQSCLSHGGETTVSQCAKVVTRLEFQTSGK